jgi:hypothetical protein
MRLPWHGAFLHIKIVLYLQGIKFYSWESETVPWVKKIFIFFIYNKIKLLNT